MSLRIMANTYLNAVTADSNLIGIIKPVAVALANRANDTGICWPSIKTLSIDTGLSVSTVKRSVHALKDSGYLTIQPRTRKDGSQTSNLYTLILISFTGAAKETVQAVKRGFSKAVEMGKEFVADKVKVIKPTSSKIGEEALALLSEDEQQTVIKRLTNKKNARLQQQINGYGLDSGYVQKALFNEIVTFKREQKKARPQQTTIEKLTDRSWADDYDQYDEFGVRITDSVL